MIDEQYQWAGEWQISVIDTITKKIIHKEKIKNKIMNSALDELIKVLNGDTPDLEIKYMAVGTDNSAITTSDTILHAEFFRTPVVEKIISGTGQLTSTFILVDAEAVGQIEEIGFFGGSTASASADTGVLISRILWSRTKTSTEEIQFTRVDTIGRG